ncbi:hypothetical protein HY969_01960 [Candidatus Kaiserbacteria bacterium]|nr:hypothetical protein [Candidatus Kaiserbacteria bacterium]
MFAATRFPNIKVASLTALFLLFVFALSVSPSAISAEGTVVVFFSGLCNGPQTCVAAESAKTVMGPRMPAGAQLIAPQLTAGAYANNTDRDRVIQQLSGKTIILVAYSAGYKAMWQTVGAMDADTMKRVKSLVSLEANYSGFENSIARVKSANPNVEVLRFYGNQFKTNHAGLPGSVGVAEAIGKLAGGDGTFTGNDTGKILASTFEKYQALTSTGNVAPSPLVPLSNSGPMSLGSMFSSQGAGTYQQSFSSSYPSTLMPQMSNAPYSYQPGTPLSTFANIAPLSAGIQSIGTAISITPTSDIFSVAAKGLGESKFAVTNSATKTSSSSPITHETTFETKKNPGIKNDSTASTSASYAFAQIMAELEMIIRDFLKLLK